MYHGPLDSYFPNGVQFSPDFLEEHFGPGDEPESLLANATIKVDIWLHVVLEPEKHKKSTKVSTDGLAKVG